MYNDVRVNLLALAALNVWRRPLPEVLKEYVMDPIGATDWRWLGYDNSWVVMDGRLVQSTPVRHGYGFMNWNLYGEPEVCSVACGESAFYHSGAGPNRIYVDPANDLVVVTRWVGNWDEVIFRMLAAIE